MKGKSNCGAVEMDTNEVRFIVFTRAVSTQNCAVS
jgi:hypothetical protein